MKPDMTRSDRLPTSAVDRLSGLLARFPVRAQLFHAGPLCGVTHFGLGHGSGFLHVLRQGELEVSHPGSRHLPRRMRFHEPSLLFYPRPLAHRFHNPPEDGADFTCAQLWFDGGASHPLVKTLPDVIALPLSRVGGLDASLGLLFAESERVRCGQRLLADRLFEVVLLQLMRWLLDHPQEAGVQPGLIMAMADPRLARCLTALHESPGEGWTLPRMADVAGMSRTAFATHFKAVVGQPPADYLLDWRMALAQTGLRHGRAIKTLADELGYANPSALSRAFAARLGLSPRDWLKRVGADAAVPDALD
jgi:AraC-like DNA-binding protein